MNKILPLLSAAFIFSSYNSLAAPTPQSQPQPQPQSQPAEAKEEKFVNPIFYQKMVSIYYPEFTLEITPTHLHIRENELITRDYNCKLTKNLQNSVALECLVYNDFYRKNQNLTFSYNLTPCQQEEYCTADDEWLVTQDITPYEMHHETFSFKISSKPLAKAPQEKFVNPIFYKTLFPLGKTKWETDLSPNLIVSHDGDAIDIQTCRLLENTSEYILFRCSYLNFSHPTYITRIYKYKIRKCNYAREFCYGNTFKIIEELMDTIDSSPFSRGYFIVDEED